MRSIDKIDEKILLVQHSLLCLIVAVAAPWLNTYVQLRTRAPVATFSHLCVASIAVRSCRLFGPALHQRCGQPHDGKVMLQLPMHMQPRRRTYGSTAIQN